MDKKFPYEDCDYQATRKGSPATRQKSVKLGKKYPCEECDYQAIYKSNLITL